MKPFVAGEPYAAKRLVALRNKIDRLSRRADMLDLIAGGVDNFVGFQDELLRLQAEAQRDITALKKTVRRNKDFRSALEAVQRLRWYSRCLGDALAWQVLLFDRKTISALMSGIRPPVAEITPNTHAVVTMSGHLMSRRYGIPILHDITNWLRIGDITFMMPGQEPDEQGNSWRFQTVELKSSVEDSEIQPDGVTHATLTVNMYCNERMNLPQTDERLIDVEIDTVKRTQPNPPRRPDRRLDRQFKRLDEMVKRRDMDENSMVTIDGVPNVVVRVPNQDTHHWPELKGAIRQARHDGFGFFSVDNYVGYAVWYRKDGVTEEHMNSFGSRCSELVLEHLMSNEATVNEILMVREIPMKEEYDIEAFPIMRFFSYKIPKYAINDFLHHRLMMVAVVNWGRVDAALVDEGFHIPPYVGDDDGPKTYSVEISWPTGERFRVQTPTNLVSREVERGLYEFCGLNDVVQKIASVKQLPELISYEDWDASLKAKTTDD